MIYILFRYLIYFLLFVIITLFTNKKSPKLYRLIIKAVDYILTHTESISKILSGIAWLCLAKEWLVIDNSPAIFIVVILLFIAFPIISLIMNLFMLVITLVCGVFLSIIRHYENITSNNYGYSNFNNFHDFNEHNNYNSSNEHNNDYYNYYNYQYNNNYQKYNNQNNNKYNSNNEYNNSYNYNKKNYSQNSSYNGSTNNSYSKTSNELNEALSFYGLKVPFSEKDLKDKRKEFMKKYHPDNGGTEEDAKKVNNYYETLKKYAS